MKIELQFKDYIAELAPFANEALSLEILLEPFGMTPKNLSECEWLLTGHFIDEVNQIYQSDSVVDIIDILDVASELGFEPAETILTADPSTLFSYLRPNELVMRKS